MAAGTAACSTSRAVHAVSGASRAVMRRASSTSAVAGSAAAGKGKQRQASSASLRLETSAPACGACGSVRHFSSTARAASPDAPSPTARLSSSTHPSSSAPPPPSTRKSALIRPVRVVPPRQTSALPKGTAASKKAKTHLPPSKPAVDQRTAEVAKLYALQAVPPTTALAALANRISPELLGSSSSLAQSQGHDQWLAKLESCCTCDSFWTAVREEERQEDIRAYQKQQESARKQPLSPESSTASEETLIPEQTGLAKRYTNFLDAERTSNADLAVLGNSLMGVFAVEWLESQYPRLPTVALKAAITRYVGPQTCADVASRQWGLQSGQAARQAFLDAKHHHIPGQPLRGVGEANRAGVGLLRWAKPSDAELRALVARQRAPGTSGQNESDSRTPLPLEEALASATRAIVGLVYQEHGFAAARAFVHEHFLSRTGDVASLLRFPNPKFTLSSTISKQGMASPTTRILAETGRLSIAPIFVLGVYSGSLKLGEGYGSSLAMAEYRACEDALRRIYLSSAERFEDIFAGTSTPATRKSQAAAAAESASMSLATLQRALPSDTLVYPGERPHEPAPVLEDETLYQSSGRSSVLSR